MRELHDKDEQRSGKTTLKSAIGPKSVLNKVFTANELNDDSQQIPSTLPEFSVEEVRYHDTPQDCWLIINDLVYDITEFIQKHPGGFEILWEHLGHDATLAFVGSGHSKGAYNMLKKFLIGRVIRD